ncbi:hypothetical protein F5144DRAFT_633257 [Chaetomium tenue]|uniref:Uncharacterized protein n=1 Tax=Chaetomium tenue TaxID=1854479 RepID=A0ACB7NUK4_9PEZI|nr:hypothetical protein F5144DRAFT_633257 [Chaetomium globosum]
MANHRKTYFFPPTWDYHPAGPLQLGNLITSPSHPADALNGPSSPHPATSTLSPPTTQTNTTWSTTDLTRGRYGLWTQFLSSLLGLGLDLATTHSAATLQTFRFAHTETRAFIPSPQFVQAVLTASPAALDFLRRSRFRKHLYMVTAVKVVRGASVRTERVRARGVEVGVEVDGAVVGGVPVSLGPEVRVEGERGEEGAFEGWSDFVFAFGLRKIVVRRGTGEVVGQAEYTKGALYDGDAGGEKGEVLFEVDEGACEEVWVDGEGGMAVVEGDEEIVCVNPQQ